MKTKILIEDWAKEYYPDGIQYATPGSAAFDLRMCARFFYDDQNNDVSCQVLSGIRIQIPEGYCGLLLPRSSLGDYGLRLKNTIGLVDSDYRGQVIIKSNKSVESLKLGDRIAQLLITRCIQIEPVYVDSLDSTERGDGGFGSSGK